MNRRVDEMKQRSYWGKTLPGVNFTNALPAAFTYISFARSFFCLRSRFVLYWRKTVGAKAACRTLMKLNPGV